MDLEKWKIYIADLRTERRYWIRQLRSKSAGAILNQGYARGKVSALDYAIKQADYWRKI